MSTASSSRRRFLLDSWVGGEVLKDEMVTNGTFLGSAIWHSPYDERARDTEDDALPWAAAGWKAKPGDGRQVQLATECAS